MASVQQNSFKGPSMRNRNQNPFLPSSNYKKCVEVYQQGYGITTSEKPFISTFGLGCCIGIVGYCKETHNAFMIHADSIKLIRNNIGTIYYHLNKASFQSSETPKTPKMYDMYLFGGNFGESSEEFAETIKHEFNTMNRHWRNRIEINFHSSYINENITNICINSNSGKFYSIDPHKCILCKNDAFMKCFELRCVMNAQTGYNNIIKYE
jgi:ferredoxin